jgi:hypothetical protein
MFIESSNNKLTSFKLNDREKDKDDKTTDNGVKNTMNLMKYIENGQVEEVNNILENEPISKNTISAGLNKALQNYKSNGDMIDLIDSLLK